MAKTTLTVPANGGPIQAVSTIQSIPYRSHGHRDGEHGRAALTIDRVIWHPMKENESGVKMISLI